MKLLLKLALLSALVLTVWFCWPSLVVPLGIFAVLGCIIGVAIAGTLAVFASVGLVLLLAVVTVLLALVLGLSPLWIPIACVIGLIHLFRRRPPVAAT